MSDIFNYLFDGFQHMEIRRARKDAAEVGYRVMDAKTDIRQLQKDHEKLKLITIALWELLKERSGLSDSELKAYVEEVDSRDGRRDGKVSASARHNCDACGRAIPASSIVCAYCGNKNHSEHVF